LNHPPADIAFQQPSIARGPVTWICGGAWRRPRLNGGVEAVEKLKHALRISQFRKNRLPFPRKTRFREGHSDFFYSLVRWLELPQGREPECRAN
jgi:hypothetical protein